MQKQPVAINFSGGLDLNMGPSLSVHDVTYGPDGHAILACEIPIPAPVTGASSDASYCLLGQFRAPVCASFWGFISSFINHIPHVVRRTPKEKVQGVDTNSIVTDMAYHAILGDWSFVQFVRYPMRSLGFMVLMEPSIAARKYRSCPWPTLVRVATLDLGKKISHTVFGHHLAVIAHV